MSTVAVVYKLTDQDMRTHGGCRWALGEWRETDGSGELCSKGWLHWYHDQLLAVMLNPVHVKFAQPRLFEAEADGTLRDDRGLKGGSTRLRLTRELPVPAVTRTQHIAFGVLCAQAVTGDRIPAWSAWADRWLSGEDRTAAEAWAAAVAWAARAAPESAESAESAAWAARATESSESVVWAARAAAAAAGAGQPLDLPALARRAMEVR